MDYDLQNIYFDKEGNMNSAGKALYVDAMLLDRVDDLPELFHEYIIDNPEAYAQIIRMYGVLQEEELPPVPTFFRQASKATILSIPDNAEELDSLLQNIIIDALRETSEQNVALERKLEAALKSFGGIKVLKPDSEALCIDQIQFEWAAPLTAKSRLFLQNQAGKFVGDFRPSIGAQIYTIDCANFPSGLYYWTLLSGSHTVTNKLYICSREDAQQLLSKNDTI